MQSKSETFTATNGALVEVGTITHEGREFAAGGSVIDLESGHIFGYPKGETLTTWNGEAIEGLQLRVTSTWRTPRSFTSDRMFAYSATYKGRSYYGRGSGEGMLLRLRLRKSN